MTFDFEKTIRFSFKWIKLSESWKYFAFIACAWLLPYIVLLYTAIIFGIPATAGLAELTETPYLSVFYFIFLPLSLLIGLFIYAITLFYALNSKGLKVLPLTPIKLAKFFLLILAEYFFSFFWSFNKKLRLLQWLCLFPLVACVLLALPSFIIINSYSPTQLEAFALQPEAFPELQHALPTFALYGFLAFLILIPYMVVVFYHFLRFFVSGAFFLHKSIGLIDSLKESWNATKGNVLNLFLLLLIYFVIMVLIMLGLVLFLMPFAFIPIIPLFDLSELFFDVFYAPISALTIGFLTTAVYSALIPKSQSKA